MGVLAAFAAVLNGAQAPDAAEQSSYLKEVRAKALAYSNELPNFVCTRVTERFRDYLGTGKDWKAVDTIEEQLTYFERREKGTLLRVNGKPPTAEGTGVGITSSGEFGSTLRMIFDPSSGTAFTWQRIENLRGRAMEVFSFYVDRGHSSAILDVPRAAAVVSFRGLVYADRETKRVMRITTEAESPEGAPLQHVIHVLDYGSVLIGGQQYFVPFHDELRLQMPVELLGDTRKRLKSRMVAIRNEVDFRDYRKYSVDSDLRFDSGDPAAKKK